MRQIEKTIDSEHDYNPKSSIHKQHSSIFECIKTGIDGDLDCKKQLYYSIRESIQKTITDYKQIEETNIPGMKLHKTATRGYHIKFIYAHFHNHNIIQRIKTAMNGNLFIEITKKKKNIYCTTASLKTQNDSLNDTFKEIMKLSQRVLNNLLTLLQINMTELHILSEYIAMIDMLSSFATYCYKSPTRCVKPELIKYPTAPIRFINAKHPILEQISMDRFIPNNVSILSSKNIQIITGPNNSGKTTYIKQTAILVIMASLGCFVPCDIAAIKLLDQIFTRDFGTTTLSALLCLYLSAVMPCWMRATLLTDAF